MFKILRSINLIVNTKTLIVASMALTVTTICHIFDLRANFPLNLIGIAVVFPIVFSINSAYQRRENSLQQLSILKAQGLSLYYATRDWPLENNGHHANLIKYMLSDILNCVRDFFLCAEEDALEKEKLTYSKFSEISKIINQLRAYGVSGSEITRLHAYLSNMIGAFDNMKNIYYYRTPITLRAYSKGFIFSFPVIYGPYFAFAFDEYAPGLAYVVPILYSFILVSLDNIQEHLENPYDLVGEDDIKIDVDAYVAIIEA
jgi:predicted membrane chloride channel (bestrophin family)